MAIETSEKRQEEINGTKSVTGSKLSRFTHLSPLRWVYRNSRLRMVITAGMAGPRPKAKKNFKNKRERERERRGKGENELTNPPDFMREFPPPRRAQVRSMTSCTRLGFDEVALPGCVAGALIEDGWDWGFTASRSDAWYWCCCCC